MLTEEQAYSQGWKRAWLSVLRRAIRELGECPETELATLIVEKTEAKLALRILCTTHGDNNWTNALRLNDVINNHLAVHLREGTNEK